MEDTQIIDLFFSRDQQAIQQTEIKYGRLCYHIAWNILSSREDAEESVSDTYLSAWNSIPPTRPAFLAAFLAKITRHISLNCCRDRSRLKRNAFICELSAEMEQCIPAPDDSSCRMDDLALRTAINDFLGKLDEEKRNIFVRRYWYLDSVADIAKRYGISESKVKTTLFRCRNRLREHLNKEGYTV